jgi:hypothetical protein
VRVSDIMLDLRMPGFAIDPYRWALPEYEPTKRLTFRP